MIRFKITSMLLSWWIIALVDPYAFYVKMRAVGREIDRLERQEEE